MPRILIIDEDPDWCGLLCHMVRRKGYQALAAANLAEGLALNHQQAVDLVCLGLCLPDGSGLDALSVLQKREPSPEVIIVTGSENREAAGIAVERGAWDYIAKSCSLQQILGSITRALQYRQEMRDVRPPVLLNRERIVGRSPALKPVLELTAQAAASDAPVLITGETGTGKEVFARTIHANSARQKGNFVVLDCTVVPANLAESLFFGHERGSFTGASTRQVGLFQQADGGTLFLDEVGELPARLQKTFLRVLQEGSFRPVGGKNELRSDFRLVSATNRDLPQMVSASRFRMDLFFRLRSLHLHLPPLRQRRLDLTELVLDYLAQRSPSPDRTGKGFSPEFLEALRAYPWPGNIRELHQALEQALAVAGDAPTLHAKHLPSYIRINLAQSVRGQSHRPALPVPLAADIPAASPSLPPAPPPLPRLQTLREAAIEKLEQEYLLELMEATGGRIEAACKISGLSRSRIYTLLRKYKIAKHYHL
ncbi:MAG: sigma-54 dependent transcriptional regulator [Deltaproteobacteria bacterium]|nr:sigma-54 dependent transcriptional regulator [Deltaproteobacteria bacterium]